jgi:formylglycine-generating enzyme required for sulfatase activity
MKMDGDKKVVRGGAWFFDRQFCRSAYRVYSQPADADLLGFGFRVVCLPPPDSLRMLRGGSLLSLPRGCRSAYRCPWLPDGALDDFGFRVVCLSSEVAP